MKKLTYVLLLIVLVNNKIKAQVPGFMGKRIAIGYNFDLGRGADWKEFDVRSDYEGNDVGFGFYPRHNITLEYVLGKSISFEASVGFSKSGLLTYENEEGMLQYEYPGLSSHYDQEPYNTAKSYDYLRVNNIMYRIGFNVFNGNYIAPHGNYWNFSYIQNHGTIQYVLNNAATDLSRVTNHGLMITKGYRRIIQSSIIVDLGFGFGCVFGPKQPKDESYTSSIEYVTTTEMQTVALNSSLLFNVHIGIKYLIPKF